LYVSETNSLWIIRDRYPLQNKMNPENTYVYHEYSLTSFGFTNKTILLERNASLSTYKPIIDHEKKQIYLFDHKNNYSLNVYQFPSSRKINEIKLPKEFYNAEPGPRIVSSFMNIDFKSDTIIYFDGFNTSCGRGGLYCLKLLGYNIKTKKSFQSNWTFQTYSLKEQNPQYAHPFYNAIHDNKFYFASRDINNDIILSTCEFNSESFCTVLKSIKISGCQSGIKFIFKGLKVYND
jgi:hypothetical protein